MATRTISTKLAVEGESEYRASLSRINNEIKTLNTSLKLVQSEYQNNANSIAALTAKGDALNALYKAQAGKIGELQAALNNAQNAEAAYAAKKQELKEKIDANNDALDKQDAKVTESGRSWASQAEIVSRCEKELGALKKTSDDTSDAQAELEKKISAAKDKMEALEAKTGGAAKSTGELLLENKNLDAELKQTEQYLDAASRGVTNWQGKLNAAKVVQNNLNAKIELNNQYLDEARKSADGCATSIDRFGKKVKESADGANDLRDALSAMGTIAALKATAAAMDACADSSITFESAMAGVSKTTDMTDDELVAMGDAIQNLATKIPATTSEIANVAEAAGQLGIAKGDILAFSEVMVNLGVATNLSSIEAASALAKFANVVSMSADNYEHLGSTIVDLGNNFATTEADIVSMATRLASAGNLVGLTEPQIMAIATALSSVGIEAEAGGSAVSKLLKQFEVMVATGSPALKEFAAVAGMSAEEFATAWGNDAVGALSTFIDGLGSVDKAGGSSVAVLDKLGITEVRLSNAVASLASSNGILARAINVANNAWTENTALAKEAATRYETTESKLQMLSNAADNAKIAVGDRLTPALGDLADVGTDVLTWAADFIERHDAIVPLVAASATAIGVLAACITGYTVVTKGAAAATVALNRAMNANPYFLMGTAISALVAGLGVLIATTNDDAVPAVSALTTAAQDMTAAIEESGTACQSSVESTAAAAEVARGYIARLQELESAGLKTEEQQREYHNILVLLCQVVPDLSSLINLQTGEIRGGTNALLANTAAWEENAKKQAYQDHLIKLTKEYTDVLIEQTRNTMSLEGATKRATDASQGMEDTMRKLCDALGMTEEEFLRHYGTVRDIPYRALSEDVANLRSEYLAYEEQLHTANAETEAYQKALEDGTEATAKAEAEIAAAEAAVERLTGAIDENSQAANDNAASQQTLISAQQDVQQQINDLAQAYRDSYDAARDSIDRQIGLFDTFSASISKDTDTVQEMMSRWAEQTANLAAYTENLKLAGQYGLDDGLVRSLSDGSAESAGYLATIIAEIERLGGTTEEMSEDADSFVKDFNSSFAETQAARDNFATVVAGIDSDFRDAVAAIEQAASEANFSGLADAMTSAFGSVGLDFVQIGSDAGIGLASGLAENTGAVSSAGAAAGQAAVDGAKRSLEENSPSRVMIRIGHYADDGLAIGIEENKTRVTSAAETVGSGLKDTMVDSSGKSVSAFIDEFSKLPDRTADVLAVLKNTVEANTSAFPDGMHTVGLGVVDGMIHGINSRSSLLYSTVRSVVSNAILTAKYAAAVNSPSKKTTEIFEFVGDGMIVGLENRRQKIRETAQSVVNDALNLNVDEKIKSAIGNIDTRIPQELSTIVATPSMVAGNPSSGGGVVVSIRIEHFENNSDKDLDGIVDYIEESLQGRTDRREAAF